MRPCEHILEVHPSARVIHVGGVGEMSAQSFRIDTEQRRKAKINVTMTSSWCPSAPPLLETPAEAASRFAGSRDNLRYVD